MDDEKGVPRSCADGSLALPAESFSQPASDDFDNATVITTFPYQESLDVSAATSAEDDPIFFGNQSVWWRYTPSIDQRVALSAVGSNFQTNIGLFVGERGALMWLFCDQNDFHVFHCDLTAGTTYYVVMSASGLDGHLLVFSLVEPYRVTDFHIEEVAHLHELPDGSRILTFTAEVTCNRSHL